VWVPFGASVILMPVDAFERPPYLGPLRKRQVGRQQHRRSFCSFGDHLKQELRAELGEGRALGYDSWRTCVVGLRQSKERK